MKSRNVLFTLLLILLLLGLAVVKRWQEPQAKELFNRTARLEYTAFALCQMRCKNISKKGIQEVMQKGLIHFNKSNRRRWPCPTYAVQARTKDSIYIRVVFEQCDRKTTVLFCDDLENEDTCNCSDDK